MKNIKEDIINIYQTNRSTLVLIIINLFLSIIFLIFSIIKLNPNVAVVKISYGDIGGYRDGAWIDMLVFPLLFLTFGILHNFIALRIFRKRGGSMAKFFLITSTTLIFWTFLVLTRLFGES